MNYKIGVISGDGIGPEIVREARKVLDAVCKKYGHEFTYTDLLLGGASIDVHGVPLTDETIENAKKCDAVLMGSIGGDANITVTATKTAKQYDVTVTGNGAADVTAAAKATYGTDYTYTLKITAGSTEITSELQ